MTAYRKFLSPLFFLPLLYAAVFLPKTLYSHLPLTSSSRSQQFKLPSNIATIASLSNENESKIGDSKDIREDLSNITSQINVFDYLRYFDVTKFLSSIYNQIADYCSSFYEISTKEIETTINDYEELERLVRKQFSFYRDLHHSNPSFLPHYRHRNKTSSSSFNSSSSVSNPNLFKYEKLIEDTQRIVSKYLSINPMEYFEYYGHDEDIIVWRLKKSVIDNNEHNKWPCIKSFTTIDLPTEQLKDLLLDSNRVTDYNRYSGGRNDIEILSSNTKIVWNKSKIPYAIKPYDFSTLIHTYQLPITSTATSSSSSSLFPLLQSHSHSKHPIIVILSTAVKHEKIPVHKDFARSEVFFAMNILSPNHLNSSRTDFTTISHVKYAGTLPLLVWRSGAQGTIQYLRSLKEAAQRHQNK